MCCIRVRVRIVYAWVYAWVHVRVRICMCTSVLYVFSCVITAITDPFGEIQARYGRFGVVFVVDHSHNELSWLWSISLVSSLDSANDLVNFQDAVFCDKMRFWRATLNMVQSLFGSVINTEVVEEHSRIIPGFESKHLDEYWWSYPHLKLYIQSYSACTSLNKFVGFLLCLERWKGCSLGFSRNRKEYSHYSMGNTERLAFSI